VNPTKASLLVPLLCMLLLPLTACTPTPSPPPTVVPDPLQPGELPLYPGVVSSDDPEHLQYTEILRAHVLDNANLRCDLSTYTAGTETIWDDVQPFYRDQLATSGWSPIVEPIAFEGVATLQAWGRGRQVFGVMVVEALPTRASALPEAILGSCLGTCPRPLEYDASQPWTASCPGPVVPNE